MKLVTFKRQWSYVVCCVCIYGVLFVQLLHIHACVCVCVSYMHVWVLTHQSVCLINEHLMVSVCVFRS